MKTIAYNLILRVWIPKRNTINKNFLPNCKKKQAIWLWRSQRGGIRSNIHIGRKVERKVESSISVRACYIQRGSALSYLSGTLLTLSGIEDFKSIPLSLFGWFSLQRAGAARVSLIFLSFRRAALRVSHFQSSASNRNRPTSRAANIHRKLAS